MMELKTRMEMLVKYLSVSRTALANKIGVKPQKLHDIFRGQTVRIPSDVLSGIIREYPIISETWLLTGEGEMLTASADLSSQGAASSLKASERSSCANDPTSLSTLLTTTQSQLSQAQEQINRLLSIIEKLSDNK